MATPESRLAALRDLMAGAGYDAFFIPRADEYLGEYIPRHSERLHWLTGFTGSAGMAVVTRDSAAMFVDGRYTVQVRSQVSPELFEFHHLIDDPPTQWLAGTLATGSRVACDPRLHSLHWYRQAGELLRDSGIELLTVDDNPIDLCWQDRPEPVYKPAIPLADALTGVSSVQKRQRIAASIRDKACDAALVFAPDSVSWLLNIRGTDMPQLPVLPSFAMLAADASMTLFADKRRLPDGFAEHVGEGVSVVAEENAREVLRRWTDNKVLADAVGASAWIQLELVKAGATLVPGDDPVQLPKACKNTIELNGSRDAHRRDAVAEVQFLAWLDGEVDAGRLHDEAFLSDQLFELRVRRDHFHACSFDTISAAGSNAAMCHYNHLNGIPAVMPMNSVYLVDSGGQYTDGTTDITRTVAIGDPGDEVRRLFTLVLKGHIALATARFPAGTTGTQLDALARQFLWREGFDYDHGTGHGVGVFLSVHEGPQRISKVHNPIALQPGMIISNEPGYYRDGCFGIRCENLQAVRAVAEGDTEKPMLEFETLTLVPFDTRLIDISLMTAPEIDWLNDYHRRVVEIIGPLVTGGDRDWLQQATRPVG